jgi:peptide/nickel transport system ATP-binding protein
MNGENGPLLRIEGLKMHFPIRKGFFEKVVGQVKAVDDVNACVLKGETLGLVGESGCGKTTVGRCIVRAYQPTGGSVFYSEADGSTVDLAALPRAALLRYRKEVRMIFQDPYASLNPRMNVFDIVAQPLRVFEAEKGQALEDKVASILKRVGLQPEYMKRYPHAFSGGQRQRIGIARALALEPRILVCDEPVSALDVSVQAQILNLLRDLQDEFGLTYVFISHDLGVVENVADRVSVMYVGKLVETAAAGELFFSPAHPYTEALLSAVPKPDPRTKAKRVILQGNIADPAHVPPGCSFHPRCGYAKDICAKECPEMGEISPGHGVACHFAKELRLQGA